MLVDIYDPINRKPICFAPSRLTSASGKMAKKYGEAQWWACCMVLVPKFALLFAHTTRLTRLHLNKLVSLLSEPCSF